MGSGMTAFLSQVGCNGACSQIVAITASPLQPAPNRITLKDFIKMIFDKFAAQFAIRPQCFKYSVKAYNSVRK